jgi:uncharacterized protein
LHPGPRSIHPDFDWRPEGQTLAAMPPYDVDRDRVSPRSSDMQTLATLEEKLLRTDLNAAGWFEIPVRDLARAKSFYEHLLGIQLDTMPKQEGCEYEMAMFPGKMEQSGATGCLSKGPEATPSDKGTLIYFNVTDIDSVLDRVRQYGGKVLREKQEIGEYGFIGIFEDPEGNRLGIHSMK